MATLATFLAIVLLCLFPCLFIISLVWLFFPKFIPLKQQTPNRSQILLRIGMGLVIYLITLVITILISSNGDHHPSDGAVFMIALILSIIISMGLSVWLTARYKDFASAQKPNITQSTAPKQPNATPTQENNTTPNTPSNTPPLPATTLDDTSITANNHANNELTQQASQNEQDWQAYKEKMEKHWQHTKQSFNKK